jgi:membrane protein DedA with SNARE-associated domain
LDYALHAVNVVAGLPPPLLYLVILVWMTVESAGVPLANEVILLFSGYLAAVGHLGLPIAWLAADLGVIVGATFAWWVASRYGPAGVDKVGRYVFLNHTRLAAAEAWFERRGAFVVLIARLTPVVRTAVSYPAGLAKMPYRPFVVSTLLGAAIWNALMLLVGQAAGDHWSELFVRFHKPALILGIVVILAVVAYFGAEQVLRQRFAERQ